MTREQPAHPFAVRPPEADPVPVVVSIPHTGTYVPPAIEASFAGEGIRRLPMTDWHLHHLYDFLPALGVTTIYATYSRFVADLNRPPTSEPLYPGRFETGLVATQTFWGEDIYLEPPDEAEVERRRKAVHQPYHERLAELLDGVSERFGRAILVDAHSIVSSPTLMTDELINDIYLGNRDGETCGDWLMATAEEGFRNADLRVVRNYPYKGGYITSHYGARDDVQAMQIEMCQRVYMNEADPANALEHPRFDRTRGILREVFGDIIEALV